VPSPLAYNVKQVAEALGVSETLVRTLIAQKRIPVAKLGDRILVPVGILESWLNAEAIASVRPERLEVG